MERAFAIFFLVIFMVQSNSTLWITASFYVQRDYISKNLCINRFDAIPICNGQCYLNKQLTENEKKEQNFPDLKQKEIQLFFQNDFYFQLDKIVFEASIAAPIYNGHFLTSDLLFSVFHPPQAV